MSSEHGVMFGTLVTLAFLVQVYNYRELGHGRVNRYTWLFVLGCYIITETMVALSLNPLYFLYVLLNVYGVYAMLSGKELR